MNPFTVDICIFACGLYVGGISVGYKVMVGVRERDMTCEIAPVGACVAGDARSYTMWIRVATGVYSAYVVLFGLLLIAAVCSLMLFSSS